MARVQAQIRVRGRVQGVGFRPFVYRLAQDDGLCGWVRNEGGGVEIAIEGESERVSAFSARLLTDAPPFARVEKVEVEMHPASGLAGFSILASSDGVAATWVAPDVAPCGECLGELFDPSNRRYRYPFINCVHCGPRYSIVSGLPYDRARTSMTGFLQCPACKDEYASMDNRRFHAEPNSCPDCGPRLALYDRGWRLHEGEPIRAAARAIREGKIVAVKGVGGFHLVCDAGNSRAIERLRSGKRRKAKPFAVMVLNNTSARRYAQVSPEEAVLLSSPERPILLLEKNDSCDFELAGAAPGLSRIGILLPSAPLDYLIFHELLGRPEGGWIEDEAAIPLIFTSANPGGEPLAASDQEARASLGGVADAFLTHDREILHRSDDSVMKGRSPAFVRRARGFAPDPLKLPAAGPSVLAAGAFLKNTICITRGDEAFVSPHIGDLEQPATRILYWKTVDRLCALLGIEPEIVVHDLHPDFPSTVFAQEYAARRNLPVVAVQHHHAHIAAVCAEHGPRRPVLGLALDGAGLGTDGKIWGGELLKVSPQGAERLGSLSPLHLFGGEAAHKEPWRMAASALSALEREDEIARRFPGRIASAMPRFGNQTTSMGRLFDAAAALLGVCEIQDYEGQAAMQIESLAKRHGRVSPMPLEIEILELDFLPLLGKLADCKDPAFGAALFHATLSFALANWAEIAAETCALDTVALGGGCFLNDFLSNELSQELKRRGLAVLQAGKFPPNDGAVSLGQAWVALQKGA